MREKKTVRWAGEITLRNQSREGMDSAKASFLSNEREELEKYRWMYLRAR
jgi:hypothetical protein